MSYKTVTLKDSRKVSYKEFGDPAGKPILFFHGSPGSSLSGELAHESALRQGARIIACDRPGYGLSSSHPAGTMIDWANDMNEVTSYLGLERFSLMGVSGGAPFALACAHQLSDRVEEVLIVAGYAPFNKDRSQNEFSEINLDYLHDMRARSRFMFRVMRYLPTKAISLLMEIIIKKTGKNSLLSFIQRVAPNVGGLGTRIVIDEFEQLARCGVQGFISDIKTVTRPWSFNLQAINVPVRLWYCIGDGNVPSTMGRYLYKCIPDSCITFFSGDNHLRGIIDGVDEALTDFLGLPNQYDEDSIYPSKSQLV